MIPRGRAQSYAPAGKAIVLSDPRTDPDGLDELAPLWGELHLHHLEVSEYRGLLRDPETSWARRRDWYRRLLSEGAVYITATDGRSRLVGYVMVALDGAADDTFDSQAGVAEVVTLVVSGTHRSGGVGASLLRAAAALAREAGADTMKIAVMEGNDRAEGFYEAHGYAVAEHVMYRPLGRR
jgi:ribosomal protein S18 acetylase RimI-like enzyme